MKRWVAGFCMALIVGLGAAAGCGGSSPNTANTKGDQGIKPPHSQESTTNTAAPRGGHSHS